MRLISLCFLLSISISQFIAQNHYFDWAISEGGTSTDLSFCITTDDEENVYVTGIFQNTVDFDPGPSVALHSSNGVSDIFIQKLSPTGELIWVKSIGGISADFGYAIATDEEGNVFVTGNFHLTVDFDPGPGVFNLIADGSQSEEDIFILKLDSDGNFVWAKKIGGPFADSGNSIDLDGTGNIYVTGIFSDQVDFDPGLGVSNISSNGDLDAFVLKLDSNGEFLWVKNMGEAKQMKEDV